MNRKQFWTCVAVVVFVACLVKCRAQGLIIDSYRFFTPTPSPTPEDIQSLRFYWNFVDLDTNNVAVSSWIDRVQGYGLGMADAAKQPVGSTGGVYFAGSPRHLTNQPQFDWEVPSGSGGTGTVWTVIRPQTPDSTYGALFAGGDGHTLNTKSGNVWAYYGESGGVDPFGSFVSDTTYDISIVFTSAGNVVVSTNNVQAINGTYGVPTSGQRYVGWDVLTFFYKGYILELAWFSNRLTSAELELLHTYATNKYQYGP